MRKKIFIPVFAIISICFIQVSYGQDLIIDNLSKVPSFINHSFYGFKNATKIGVMNKFKGKTFENALEYRYAFANTHFDYSSFSLGVDFYNSTLSNSGYSNTQASISYVYEMQFYNDWYLYTGLTGGFSSTSYNYNNLVFQDQIDKFSNQIYLTTFDPLADNSKFNYIDIGASFMMHNDENMIFGLSLNHLNAPKNIVDESQNYKLEILASAQFGYEFDLNKYGRNMLPEYSYLYVFSVLSKQGSKLRMDFYQELNLSTFGFGISEHLNYLEDAHIHEMGINATLHADFFDFGFNYKMPLTGTSKNIVDNSLSAYLIFDLDPYRSGRRGNFSVFY